MSISEGHPLRRRFNLRDGLILIAALAITLSVLRSTAWLARFQVCAGFWWEMLPSLVMGRLNPMLVRSYAYSVIDELFVRGLSSLLLGLTLAQPVMHLRRPRSPLRDTFRQSGFVVCLVMIVGALILSALLWVAEFEFSGWLSDLRPGRVIGDPWVARWGVNGRMTLVFALLLCWPVLGLSPWRSEAGWIDRLGRAVGWGWIVVMASVTVLTDL